jgi:uncharacterized repeat protein (TIGR01451 family)
MKRLFSGALLAVLLAAGCTDLTTPGVAVLPMSPSFQLAGISSIGDNYCTPAGTSSIQSSSVSMMTMSGGIPGIDENAAEGASEIYGSNDNGWFAGRVRRSGAWLPAYKEPGQPWEELSTESGIAFDINNNNQVVGYISSGGTRDAYVWQVGGGATLIRAAAEARAINESGQVAGTLLGSMPTAFRWNGVLTDLGTAGGLATRGYGINSSGHVSGSVNEGLDSGQAFLHDGSTYQLIPNPVGYGSGIGYSVNDHGEVVGVVRSTTSLIEVRGFYAEVAGGTVSGQKLVPLLPGGVRNIAYAINNNGMVVGRSVQSGGEWQAFMWDARHPLAEPVELVKISGSCGAEARTINICDQAGGLSTWPDGKLPTATAWGGCTQPQPDLEVVKTAGSSMVAAGAAISFNIVVTNKGPGTATGVTLSDDLPGGPGLNWSTATPNCSVTGTAPNQALSCDFGDILAGGMRWVTVTSPTTGLSCGVYNNVAQVSATNHASVPSNQASVTVVNCTPPAPVKCEEGIRDIRIRNLGIPDNPLITVTNSDVRKPGEIIWFRGHVAHNPDLSIWPAQPSDFHVDARTPVQGKEDKKLGSNIFIYVGDSQRPLTWIHTACSQPAGPGLMTPTVQTWFPGYQASPDIGNVGPGGSRVFLVTQAFIVKGAELGPNDPRFMDKHFPNKGVGVPVPTTVMQQVINAGGIFP